MEDKVIMSRKELKRKGVMELVRQGHMSLKEAAVKLDLSYRQTKRVWKRYREQGDGGLVHRARGKATGRGYPAAFKRDVLAYYERSYLGYGPTLASEKLQQREGVKVPAETLRGWLKQAGLWHRQRKRKTYRQRRERRGCFGELLQIDGSDHAWFGGNERSCLINLVDDATGISYAQLDKGETTAMLLYCLKRWLEQYGVPKAVYVDRKTVYIGQKGLSVFQQVCQRLGIEVIRAYSPQAKGRVERKHAVYQDRFVKELALQNIKTIPRANALLEACFLAELNGRFSQPPREACDAHRKITRREADQTIYWCEQRTVGNDWTVSLAGKCYQLGKTRPLRVRAGQRVELRRYLNGRLKIMRHEEALPYQELSERPQKPPANLKHKGRSSALASQRARQNKHRTPWSLHNPQWLKGQSQRSR